MKTWSEMTPDEKRKVVASLAAKGMSASETADRLKCTRNAVIGFAHRNGMRFGKPGEKARKRSAAKPKVERKPKTKAKVKPKPKPKAPTAEIEPAPKPSPQPLRAPAVKKRRPFRKPPSPIPQPPSMEGVRLFDAQRYQCRRPLFDDARVGDPWDLMVCGKPVEPGHSYCRACCAVLFVKPHFADPLMEDAA